MQAWCRRAGCERASLSVQQQRVWQQIVRDKVWAAPACSGPSTLWWEHSEGDGMRSVGSSGWLCSGGVRRARQRGSPAKYLVPAWSWSEKDKHWAKSLVQGTWKTCRAWGKGKQKVKVKGTQLCPALCDPMDCILYSPWNSPGSQSTGGASCSLSRESSQPRDQTQVSRIAGGFFTSWATREAQREGRRGCNQRHLDPSACCPSPHQVGGLRRGSGPTSCWLWAGGNLRLDTVSLRCWERARARPQLEGRKTRSSLKLEADFPSRSWSFTGALYVARQNVSVQFGLFLNLYKWFMFCFFFLSWGSFTHYYVCAFSCVSYILLLVTTVV